MNRNLTEKVKKFALELGADLVGIAPIERFAGAPLMMSPQGLMPTARNVIVCAIHHPDAAMELGGEKHPQKIGPYSIQYEMNCKLDYIAFRVAKLIDTLGYDVIPIASSNIWRYRDFMNLKANFAPDMSHIYAATCAGLGQLGWQGLTMSPEYGPWNRFISIITNAPLCGTPMYEDIKLCDMCGECIKHCPTDAYRKEVNGVNSIEVEGKTFKFANKNLWRCAWGEHFELDLDLEIPDVVNEEVILDNINKYGSRGGEMGCCVKYCLPAHLRQDGGDFTTTYIRKKHVYASDLPVHRRLYDDLAGLAQRYAVDNIAFLDEETLNNAGIDYKNVFSPAKGAVVYSISLKKAEGELPESELLRSHGRGDGVLSAGINPEGAALSFFRGFANLDIARTLENEGFQALNSVQDQEKYAEAAGLNNIMDKAGCTSSTVKIGTGEGCPTYKRVYGVVLTSAAFKRTIFTGLQEPVDNLRLSLTENLSEQIRAEGSDTYAIIPARRLDTLTEKLESIKGGEKLFLARDKNQMFKEYLPEVHEVQRRIYKPSDYLKDAKSVIIFGLHFPGKVSEMALQPPAYAVGPYTFATYQTCFELSFSALKICKYLQGKGYDAVMTADLTGLGGDIGSPRGFLNDAFCNSLEAVEAGLGELAANGVCHTLKHGMNQRFMAIVTDAPLEEFISVESPGTKISGYCADCRKCIEACPANALLLEKAVEIELGGRRYKWIPTSSSRCEWAKKYALCGEDGSKYTGSTTEVPLPERIDSENLAAALKTSDRVLKFRPTTSERCIVDCPLQRIGTGI